MKCMYCNAEMKKDGGAFFCPVCEAIFNKGLWVMPANGEDAERIQKRIRKEFKRESARNSKETILATGGFTARKEARLFQGCARKAA